MSNLSGVRNLQKEPVELDPKRPILFIDIDGVVNAIPYVKEWIGPEGKGTYESLRDPANWRWVKLPHDPELHFEPALSLDVSFDNWAFYSGDELEWLRKSDPDERSRIKRLRLSVAEEMLVELRKLIARYEMQVVYLTFWRGEALRLLEPTLQLGAVGFLDWRVGSDLGHRLKMLALAELYEDYELRNPFVVIDDESLAGMTEDSELWRAPKAGTQERIESVRQLNEVPRLYIEPDARWGIEKRHIRDMQRFLDKLPK